MGTMVLPALLLFLQRDLRFRDGVETGGVR
jgi:hypothetical protein